MIDSANNTKADEYPSGDKIFTGSDDNKKEFTVTISFGWGALFEGKNPGRYLDGEDGLTVSPENKTALLVIANAENTGANYSELNANAKRDILTAMKNAIAASEAKFTVVVNAQAK